MGTLTYGETPMGYDGWSYREYAGGGTVTLPFTIRDGELYVGLILQRRPNQGGEVWNAPRGFLDPGETREAGAARELNEETGFEHSAALVTLPGEPGNPNSTFFETWATDEGVTFHAVQIHANMVELGLSGLGFRAGILDESASARRSRVAEAITQARFLPWAQAAQVGDLLTNAAVARLLAHLQAVGEISVVTVSAHR